MTFFDWVCGAGVAFSLWVCFWVGLTPRRLDLWVRAVICYGAYGATFVILYVWCRG